MFSEVTDEFYPTSEEVRLRRASLHYEEQHSMGPLDLWKILVFTLEMQHKPETFMTVFVSLRLVLRNVHLFNISMRCQAG